MHQRQIGDTSVSAIGFGAMHFSLMEPQDEAESTRTLHAALDAGVTLVDTALAYTGTGLVAHNEQVVGKGLRSHPSGSSVLVATKGGHYRSGSRFPKDGRPEAVRKHCETSLQALGVEAIGLYQLHWPDPNVPIAETMGAFAELQREGKVRMVGVCNFSIEQIEEARSVVEVVSVQNSFAPTALVDRPTLRYCAENGIAYLPWCPLGGAGGAKGIGDAIPGLAKIAEARGVSPQQVALAWHLAQSPTVLPIPGAHHPASIIDSAAAGDLRLDADELAVLP